MNKISEQEFRQLCQAVFDPAAPYTEETQLLQQVLVLTRHKLGHARPGTGAFITGPNASDTFRQDLIGLLLMRREPFFDASKVINEFLDGHRQKT